MIANVDFKDLVEGQHYKSNGITEDIAGEQYQMIVVGPKVVLYHVSRFIEAVFVSEDEF